MLPVERLPVAYRTAVIIDAPPYAARDVIGNPPFVAAVAGQQ